MSDAGINNCDNRRSNQETLAANGFLRQTGKRQKISASGLNPNRPDVVLSIADHDRVLQVAAFARMACSEGFLPMDHKYCSVMPALDKFSCSSVIPTVNPCCRSPFGVHPAWIAEHLSPWRCHCLPSPRPAWKRLSTSGRSVCLDSNAPVLVRGERDGFYYRGTVKEEIEGERGVFLVEFAKPLVSRGRHPVCEQKTAKDDILEYVNGMKHSLLPGDKVLAPWEPEMARYGPGTVLMGIEMRDPLRASENEEIVVQFWNDKKVKLPCDVALWIPPSLWERIVEMIHMPFTSRVKPRESPNTNSCNFSCSPKPAPIPLCAVHSLAKHYLLCSPCLPHFHYCCDGICCLPAYIRCICCCQPCVDAWWPLLSRSLVFQRETEEAESISEPPPHLLELEGPNQEGTAAVAAPSPSSDSEWDPEPFSTKSTVVDSAVNTDSSSLEKPRLKNSARPEGKYWKRRHNFHPSNSGLSNPSSTCTEGKQKSKAISIVDRSSAALTNHLGVFETIEQSPRGQLATKGIPRDQDCEPSFGIRKKSLQHQENKGIKEQERKQNQVINVKQLTQMTNLMIQTISEDREKKPSKDLTCNTPEMCDQPKFNR